MGESLFGIALSNTEWSRRACCPVRSCRRGVWQRSRFLFDPEMAHSDLRRIPAAYQSNGGGFWLMRDSQIIGTVAIRRLSADVAEVKRLNVSESDRGRGLGRQLLRHAVRHATDTGFSCVRLDTIRNDGPAVHLFMKYGFVEITRYNDNADADIFMELDLRKAETEAASSSTEA